MSHCLRTLSSSLVLISFLGLQACGGDPQPTDNPTAESASPKAVEPADTGGDAAPAPAEQVEAQAAAEAAGDEEAVQEIDPEELEPAGEIELKQYTVAWVGSGTMGGGTLIMDGKEYPFRLAGLGIGGYGASSIDASGVVYNLPSMEAFAGTYGNARTGMTGGDAGKGKLWLKNEDGVVIKLESKMRGLALGTGVDGILIQWEDEGDSKVDEAMDGTRDVAGDAIEAGADVVQDGADKVKGWFKKKD